MQEVCDRVGIMAAGRMVKEGSLKELTAVDNQNELLLENASPELLEKLQAMIAADGKAKLLKSGQPSTTLERLFLEVTAANSQDS
jgi:ABC-2 type transport system ATP-binding protein